MGEGSHQFSLSKHTIERMLSRRKEADLFAGITITIKTGSRGATCESFQDHSSIITGQFCSADRDFIDLPFAKTVTRKGKRLR
jgi:hypothetical protein